MIFNHFMTRSTHEAVLSVPVLPPIPFKFISLADGAGMIKHDMLWIFQNQTFLDLIAPFSPGYYRFGGTRNDLLFFDEDSPEVDFDPNDCSWKNTMSGRISKFIFDEPLEHQKITRREIGHIYNAVKCSGLELIYGLNLNLRKHDAWISSNTEALLKFISKSSMKMHFELGNEPNSYYHKFETKMTPKMQTHDIKTLKKLLKKNNLQDSKIFGPDSTSSHVNGLTYLLRFIKRAEPLISEITYHHYSLNGHKSKFNDFLNPASFQIFEDNVKVWVQNIRNVTDLRINLGETAVAYGGGEAGLTDRFVGSFMWANKLGLAATYGIKSVMREAVISSNYRLIGADLIPNPDYWITLAFKNLFYKQVFKAKLETNSRHLKVYASTKLNDQRKWLFLT